MYKTADRDRVDDVLAAGEALEAGTFEQWREMIGMHRSQYIDRKLGSVAHRIAWLFCSAFIAGFNARRAPSGTVKRDINDTPARSVSASPSACRTAETTGSVAALRSSNPSSLRTWVTPHNSPL